MPGPEKDTELRSSTHLHEIPKTLLTALRAETFRISTLLPTAEFFARRYLACDSLAYCFAAKIIIYGARDCPSTSVVTRWPARSAPSIFPFQTGDVSVPAQCSLPIGARNA